MDVVDDVVVDADVSVFVVVVLVDDETVVLDLAVPVESTPLAPSAVWSKLN